MKNIILIFAIILFGKLLRTDAIAQDTIINGICVFDKLSNYKQLHSPFLNFKNIKLNYNKNNNYYFSLDSLSIQYYYNNSTTCKTKNKSLKSFIKINNKVFILDSILIIRPFTHNTKGLKHKLTFEGNPNQDYDLKYQKFELKGCDIYTFRIHMDNCNGTGCWNEYSFFIIIKADNIDLFALEHLPYQELQPWSDKSLFVDTVNNSLCLWYFTTSKNWNELPKEGYIEKLNITNEKKIYIDKKYYIKDINESIPPFINNYIIRLIKSS